MHIFLALLLLPILILSPLTSGAVEWTGAVSADWAVGANWDGGSPPGATDDAVIPAGAPFLPVVSQDAGCLNLTVQDDAALTVNGSVTLTVNGALVNQGALTVEGIVQVAGNWTNDGVAEGNGLIEFTGNSGQQLGGTGPVMPDVDLRGGGAGKTAVTDLDFNGEFEINSGNTFSDGGYTISVAGRWSRRGTYIADGTLVLDGADQTFTFGAFSHLILAGTGEKTPTRGAIMIAGSLSVTAGVTFSKSNIDLIIEGAMTNHGIIDGTSGQISVAGPVINTGLIEASGDMAFIGDSQTVTGPGIFDIPIVIQNTGVASAGGDLDFRDDFIIDPGGSFDSEGYDITVGTDGAGNDILVGGNLVLAAGASLRVASGMTIRVMDGGTLRAAGTDEENRARFLNQGVGGYAITIEDGGTIDARFTTFEHLTGAGIEISEQALIHPVSALNHTIFRNGAGDAYLTIRNSQSLTLPGVFFDTGPAYNISKPVDNDGRLTFAQYDGALGGPVFENDPSARIGWTTGIVRLVGPGEQHTFSGVNAPGEADLEMDVSAGAGEVSVTVVYGYHPMTPDAIGRYFTITAPPGLTADVTFHYEPSELGDQEEAALQLWRLDGNRLEGPIPPDDHDLTAHAITKYNVSAFSDWLIGAMVEDITLAVELSRFEAVPGHGKITLAWRTESEINNIEWQLERSASPDKGYRHIASIPGQGSKPTATEYTYVDTTVVPDTVYYYRLIDMETTGVTTMHGPVQAVVLPPAVPLKFRLAQNTPNPFNPSTEIVYDVPVSAPVSLTIYNILGQRVRKLVDAGHSAGSYRVSWNGRDDHGRTVPTGLYLYRITAGPFSSTRKMVLIR